MKNKERILLIKIFAKLGQIRNLIQDYLEEDIPKEPVEIDNKNNYCSDCVRKSDKKYCHAGILMNINKKYCTYKKYELINKN